MISYTEDINTIYILSSFILSFGVYFFIKLIPKYFHFLFGISVSNNKTSKFHLPMVRGIGIIFGIILVSSSILLDNIFDIFELFIISLSTLIGFWDDKYELKQKQKLLFFLILGVVWASYNSNFSKIDIYLIFSFTSYLTIFVFLVLFFNQIDGINGLATGTFLICLLYIYVTGTSLILFLPVILSIIAYFFINIYGKIGIQGDAGSFFMGSFIALLYTKSRQFGELGLIFFILGPLVFDICSTPIIRFYYKISLSLGHNEHLYQKLVSKYQNHILVTLIFMFAQLLFCIFLFKILEQHTLISTYIILFLLCSVFMAISIFISYLIRNKKIFK